MFFQPLLQIQELRGSIRVFARIRPCKDADVAVLSTEGELGLDQVQVMDKMRQWKSFTFDRVYGPQTTQMDIYQELAPLMRSVLDGYSVCIFAYGQTSSGKTYTMSGPSDRPKSDATKGLQYRVLDDLFDQTAERTASGEMEFTVSVQMLEIYNEQLRDLLVPPASPSKSDFRFIDGVVNTKAIDVSHTDDVVKVSENAQGSTPAVPPLCATPCRSTTLGTLKPVLFRVENLVLKTFSGLILAAYSAPPEVPQGRSDCAFGF